METVAEQIIRAKGDLDAVYQAGYTKGLAEGGGDALPFTETGAIVRCFPLTKYPLTLKANMDCKVKHCGKNLFSTDMVRDKIMSYDDANEVWRIDTKENSGSTAAYASLFAPITGLNSKPDESNLPKCIRVPENAPITITFEDYSVHTTDGSVIGETTEIMTVRFYKADTSVISTVYRFTGDISSISFVTPKETAYLDIRRNNAVRIISFRTLQIEIDSNPTDYAPYDAKTYTLTANEPIEITPFDGSNYLVAGDGEITVSGRLNAQAMYEVLINEIISLGSDI